LTELSVNAAKYPHVLIIGKTGSGKSTIAQGLAALSPGKKFAIAPHLDPSKLDDEWRGCNGVFCGGRNYGSEDDPVISYEDLIHNRVKNATAYQVLRALHDEMDRRYKDPAGFDSHEQHDWFLDETPAIAKNLDKWFGKLVSPQAYEARKVKLRLWIITQNDNVRAMKLEGEGRVRDNFTYLYLGEQAKKRLRYLVAKGVQPESALAVSYNRLAVVDETPCEVPDKDVLETRIDSNTPNARFVQFYSGDIVLPEAPKPVPKTWEDFKDSVRVYDELMTWGLDNGKSKRVIVESLWGFKGKNYSLGCEFYDRLIPETIEA
jgi:energy-coupling factor transporter ATP-binding protein EcfA2